MKNNIDPLLFSSDNDADGYGKADLEEFIDSTDPNVKDEKRKSSTIWIVIVIILALLLLVIGGGMGIFLFMKKKSDSEPASDMVDTPLGNPIPAPNDNVADPIQETP